MAARRNKHTLVPGEPKTLAEVSNSIRPPGSLTKEHQDLMQMGLESLRRLGGVEYLVKQGMNNPGTYMSFISRLLPFVIRADAGNLQIVIQSLQTDVTPVPGVMNSIVPGHINGVLTEADDDEEAACH